MSMRCGKLFETIDALNGVYTDIWEDVVNLESPTTDKAGVDAVGLYFIRMAEEKGWQAEKLPLENAGDPICITMNPNAPGECIVLSGHIDTVHAVGSFGTPAVRRDERDMFGPGALDCKGGVVASFMAMDALERCGFRERPVKLIIQTDEETGSLQSGKATVAFMIEKAKGAAAFLNAEPIKGNACVLMRKGILRCRFTVHGKAAHAARPDKGASAIAEAAHKIIRLEKLKDLEGITCNCGVIQGGTVANSVAGECTFMADCRFADADQYEQAVRILEETAAHSDVSGCTCTLERVSYRPAMPLTERNRALFDRANNIFAENGLPVLEMTGNKGGSDAAYITEAGIPCIDSIGAEGGYMHTTYEFAALESLAQSAKRLASIVYCL